MDRCTRLTASAVFALSLLTGSAYAAPENGDDNVPANTTAARDHSRADHVEGHIAFLHAELAITPAEENAWSKVADAMRSDVNDYQAEVAKYPAGGATPPSAIESLQERAAFIELHAKGERRFVSAFEPLYAMLTPDQKTRADDLFANYGND